MDPKQMSEQDLKALGFDIKIQIEYLENELKNKKATLENDLNLVMNELSARAQVREREEQSARAQQAEKAEQERIANEAAQKSGDPDPAASTPTTPRAPTPKPEVQADSDKPNAAAQSAPKPLKKAK